MNNKLYEKVIKSYSEKKKIMEPDKTVLEDAMKLAVVLQKAGCSG